MSDSPETYMKKVSAMCARPILSTREDREQFLRRLHAHWLRQLNLYNAGKPIQFNPLEVNEIIDAIDEMLSAIRKENS
jgi:hypothetical protein